MTDPVAGCGEGLGAAFYYGGRTLALALVFVAMIGALVGAIFGIDYGEQSERARRLLERGPEP